MIVLANSATVEPLDAGAALAGDAAGAGSLERRFGGVSRLLGAGALARLQASHFVVVGVGGVGSWAAEALARSGAGALTLIDMDHVAESNINRQVHALEATLGAAKGEAMRERIAGIWRGCRVTLVDDFVTAENAAALLPDDAIVVDAIDQPRAKAAMIALCRRRGQPLVVCGGAGAVTDGLGLKRADLALVRGDPLLASVRARLRREHGFPREAGKRFGVAALYFEAQRVRPATAASGVAARAAGVGGDAAGDDAAACEVPARAGAPLACAGYGSLVTVTAALGFAAAGLAIEAALR
ncbi:MAG TPA: ThiF family adenylyltransferase [Quisquiliibacterium sp.]|nr:ThiF family adenylyltransferase [Quisquiliibacterium sp.]